MSKLYNALERLEQIAEEQSDDQETAQILTRERTAGRASSLPWRTLALSLGLILLGLLVLGLLSWWQGWLHLPAPTGDERRTAASAERPEAAVLPVPQTQPVDTDDPTAVPAADPSVVSIATAGGDISTVQPNIQEQTKESSSAPSVRQQPVPDRRQAGADLAGQQDRQDLSEPQDQKVARGSRTAASVRIADSSVRLKTPAGSPASERQGAMFSRWLLQAEQRRQEGDWAGAARLYRLVWESTGNPAVANNLAASLLQLGKVAEARVVLEKALQTAPGDRDLLLNRELAERLATKPR